MIINVTLINDKFSNNFPTFSKKKKKKSGVIRHYDSPSMVEIATNYVIIEKI